MNSCETISLLLVDDHEMFQDSLKWLFQDHPEIQVIGTACNAEEAIERTLELEPAIVLMDIDMPGLICFDGAARIRSLRPETRIIFLSAFFHDHYIEQALNVSAWGYLTKSEPSGRLIEAIKMVSRGRVYFSEQVRSRIVADSSGVRLAKHDEQTSNSLSSREVEVLRYLSRGRSKKEIAGTMHISVKTVEGHTQRIMKKLDIHDRVELARYAIREGLADP